MVFGMSLSNQLRSGLFAQKYVLCAFSFSSSFSPVCICTRYLEKFLELDGLCVVRDAPTWSHPAHTLLSRILTVTWYILPRNDQPNYLRSARVSPINIRRVYVYETRALFLVAGFNLNVHARDFRKKPQKLRNEVGTERHWNTMTERSTVGFIQKVLEQNTYEGYGMYSVCE